MGTFITNCRCEGYFFGIVDGYDAEVKVWAEEAIEEVEDLIAEHGLNITKDGFNGKKYDRYHIGNPVIRKAVSCQKE